MSAVLTPGLPSSCRRPSPRPRARRHRSTRSIIRRCTCQRCWSRSSSRRTRLLALLIVGALSDHVGRRTVIIDALAIQLAAMILFIFAGNAAELITARAIQGLATGAGTAALAARADGSGSCKGSARQQRVPGGRHGSGRTRISGPDNGRGLSHRRNLHHSRGPPGRSR
ncbi:MFS transporter [Arthrobacter globiformis]|uniref:MFS transporter n=1 Tax=Arthrobacter globiformis TaxID=1665 RepID=UPI00358F9E7D